VLCSDDEAYGGSGVHAIGPDGVDTMPIDSHGQFQSILVTVPPLAVVALTPDDA
jgi:1,4-alpha-glucan branching enzyme